VNLFMYLKDISRTEAFPTLLISISFLSTVNHFMILKGTGISERFITFLTSIVSL
jgi:hypothetical protein